MATHSKREKRTASKTVGSPSTPRRSLFQNEATKTSAQMKKKKTAAERKAKSAPVEKIAPPGIVVEQEADKDAFWEVESVVGRKKIKGKVHFKIRWKGCSADQDTWEPETNLCDSALEEALAFEAAEMKEKQAPKKVTEADAKQVTATPAVTSEAAQVSGATNDEAKPEADMPAVAVDATVEMPVSKPAQKKVKKANAKQVAAKSAVTPEAEQVSGATNDKAKPEADMPAVDASAEIPVSKQAQKKVKEVDAKQAAAKLEVASEAEQVSGTTNDEVKPEADMPAVDATEEIPVSKQAQNKVKEVDAEQAAATAAVTSEAEQVCGATNDEAEFETDMALVDAAVEIPVTKPEPEKVKEADAKQVAATPAVTSEVAQVSGARNDEAKPEADMPEVEIAERPNKKARREGKKVAAKSILPVLSAQDSDAKNDELKLKVATSAVDDAAKTTAVSNLLQMAMSATRPTGEMTVEK